MNTNAIRQRLCKLQRNDILMMREKLFCKAPETKPARRSRSTPAHVWPEVGSELTAEYFGVSYRAVIITARKKLKSGRQIRIESGPASGTVCDSLSDAMIKATHKQRQDGHLRRKGVSNGWDFWQWAGK